MKIYMETESVTEFAKQFECFNDQIRSNINMLNQKIHEIPWEGGNHQSFLSDFSKLKRKFYNCSELGLQISRSIYSEVNQCELPQEKWTTS